MPRPPLFQRATVTRVIRETADTRTFVIAPSSGPFTYRAGQFVTFRLQIDGEELLRSYSMSSAPETDTEMMTTVKRVPGGQVSNWLIDNVSPGDEVEITEPHGVFCLRDTDVPLLGFCGGSGITPVLSLAKSALAGTKRSVRLLCADRDQPSMIFETALADLVAQYPDRLTVVRHLDTDSGYVDAAGVAAFVGEDTDADVYVCGPEPFMDLVENSFPGPGKVFTERFGAAAVTAPATEAAVEAGDPAATATAELEGTVTIHLRRKKITVPRRPGETLLESARRGGLAPPFSCESGTCATCIAKLEEGSATMRVNEALTEEEVEEGYVLTCQGVPDSASVVVRYE
ncbi:oxidoreductase [Parafrankia colletiae]|uniref:Oxidoreductase n=1 Tax=Parafrankia colletiae TaxID=573497 RepID=A0A1S1QEP6_9ACTN|nr:ferredoxin--NADP reductase [Parafrankia colletiae]MCK9902023.1 ferredoxin--NADP reductase [Frankia sp. Cpl3]OHV33268.1 oxidoreductase [Parafrankia colletiae]